MPNYLTKTTELAVFQSLEPHPFQLLLTREEAEDTHLVRVSEWETLSFRRIDSRLEKLVALQRMIADEEILAKERIQRLEDKLAAIRNDPVVDSSVDMGGGAA